MPELPDVETMRRYVDATSLHKKIVGVEVNAPRMLKGVSAGRFAANLENQRFESTERHGKFLFVELGADSWLVLHFGMTGHLEYRKNARKATPPVRLLVRFSNGYELAGIWQRRLGRIGLTESPAALARDQGLGPDAYEPELALEDFRRMVRGRRGSVRSALMDQGFMAGIGNIYSDEILFQAQIHPRAEARRMNGEALAQLHRVMRHVLRVAIERQADPERLPSSWLLPHRREGEHCPRCGATLRRIDFSGRTSFLCPACQRRSA